MFFYVKLDHLLSFGLETKQLNLTQTGDNNKIFRAFIKQNE
jgi:hypothetical protein